MGSTLVHPNKLNLVPSPFNQVLFETLLSGAPTSLGCYQQVAYAKYGGACSQQGRASCQQEILL